MGEVQQIERYTSSVNELPSLKSRRAFACLTQVELAKVAGLSVGTVARIEQGHRASAWATRRLAVALGCRPAVLLVDEYDDKEALCHY